jgi:hypothetical protein
MSRRFRWILLVLVVVVVGGAVALVVVERPKLQDAQDAVDARWKPLRATDALVLRYQKLEGALSAFDVAGGTDRSVSKDLHAALAAWHRALESGDARSQATSADAVENQARRLRANVDGSVRLHADAAINDALTAFVGTRPPESVVAAYNAAVRRYESQRTSTWSRPVARVLGYDARPVLILAA